MERRLVMLVRLVRPVWLVRSVRSVRLVRPVRLLRLVRGSCSGFPPTGQISPLGLPAPCRLYIILNCVKLNIIRDISGKASQPTEIKTELCGGGETKDTQLCR